MDTVEVTVTGDAVFVILSGNTTADGVAIAVAVLLRLISAKADPRYGVLQSRSLDADEATTEGVCSGAGMQSSNNVTDDGANIDAQYRSRHCCGRKDKKGG